MLKKVMIAVYLLVVAFCLLSLFGSLEALYPTEQVTGRIDDKNNSYSGAYQASSGEFVGSMEIVFANGDIYSGELEGGRFNGEGVYKSSTGWSFSGQFKEGRLSGDGEFQGLDSSYVGAFLDSAPSGDGQLTATAGQRYQGGFQNGKPSGEGTYYAADGATYTGGFSKGYADGYGEVTDETWSYRGNFTVGYRNGQGRMEQNDGTVLEGQWEAGFLIEP